MADFRAKIIGDLDLSQAQNKINAFINTPYKIKIDVDLLNNGNPLNGIIKQYNRIGSQAGAQFASAFNSGTQTANVNQLAQHINRLTINLRQAQQHTQALDNTMRNTFDNKMTAWARNNTRAVNAYAQELQNLHGRLASATTMTEFNQIKREFAELQSHARATGNVGKTMGEQFTSALGSVTKFAASYVSVYQLFNAIKQGVNTVRELDDALVDLQKTTSGTSIQLNDFYYEANNIAKQYGATTQQIIQSAADWSRLGYSLADSKTMAKLSSQFAAISPGVDVEKATSGLVSIMKAFDISADEALDGVMSKINIVGNSFAVSNDNILEGLQRSSAAMSAMNQDLDSTVALFTAANEILQDSASAGTAIRNLSLRLRGFDEETEQVSEELVGVTGKIADLTKTASQPLGISIFTDASQEHYKNFVDYFRELSQIWDDLSEKNQAELLNTIFGKRGASAGAAIIKNFETVEAALEKMKNSAGNADAEMAIITQSITYHLNALKETWTGIAQSLFQRGDLTGFFDGLTAISEVIGKVTTKLGLMKTAIGAGGIIVAIRSLV